MRAYKVTVKTTDPLKRTTWKNIESEQIGKEQYFECENGILWVVTDDPKKIYEKFSPETVISIEDVGVGYNL